MWHVNPEKRDAGCTQYYLSVIRYGSISYGFDPGWNAATLKMGDVVPRRCSGRVGPSSPTTLQCFVEGGQRYGSALTALRSSCTCAVLQMVWPGTSDGSVYEGSGLPSLV